MPGPNRSDDTAALTRVISLAFLVFAPVAWASNIVVGRALNGVTDPDLLNFLRWAGTTLVLMPFVLGNAVRSRHEIGKVFWKLAAAGLVGMGLFQWLLYLAVSHTSATHVASALALSPAVALLLKEQTGSRSRWLWGGFAVSLAGVALVQADALTANDVNTSLFGLAIGLLAALLWGGYGVLVARLPKTLPPFTALWVMSLVALGFSVGPVVLSGSVGQIQTLPPTAWVAIAHLVVVVSIAGLAAYNTGTRNMGAEVGAHFIHLTPPFAVAMGALFLGETVALIDMVGFVLTISGLAVVYRQAGQS
ncbi:MAG: DMT family transporter [Pseudooceanicola sp.]